MNVTNSVIENCEYYQQPMSHLTSNTNSECYKQCHTKEPMSQSMSNTNSECYKQGHITQPMSIHRQSQTVNITNNVV